MTEMVTEKIERKICWRILRRCNLSCSHCLAGDLGLFKNELSTAACLTLVERFAECSLDRVVVTGGEPLLRRDLEVILFSLSVKGTSVHLTTNGLGLSADRISALRKCVDTFRVSIDGLEGTHNEIRRHKSFQPAVLGIYHALKQGCRVIVNSVLSKKNIHEIPSLVDTLADVGVREFVLLELMLRERGVSFKDHAVSDSDQRDLRGALLPILVKRPDVRVQFRTYSEREHRQVVVESDGSVMLCSEVDADLYLGNLRESSVPLKKALSQQRIPPAQVITASPSEVVPERRERSEKRTEQP